MKMRKVLTTAAVAFAGAALMMSCSGGEETVWGWPGADYPQRDMEENPKTILLLTDTHVMAPELLKSEGAAFERYVKYDPKLLEYSVEVLQGIVDAAVARHPDLVVIPGDLTKDGEAVSHRLVVNILGNLRAAGIPVVVVPGNHDIENPNGSYFDGDQKYPAERTSPSLFVELYNDFGYGRALSRDMTSLSYAIEPLDGLVLLCIDTNRYDENKYVERGDSRNVNMTAGRIRTTTMEWLLQQADKACAAGKQVVVVQHHNLVQHYDAQEILQGEYIIDDYEDAARQMMNHGIHLAITGHQHLHDIAQYRVKEGTAADSIVDVATGSAVAYPNPWRTVVASNDFTKWRISTEYVSSLQGLSDVQQKSYDRLYANLYSGLTANIDDVWSKVENYRTSLTLLGMPADLLPSSASEFANLLIDNVGDDLRELFMIYNAGNEGANPRSEWLLEDIRTRLFNMCRQRLVDTGIGEARTNNCMATLSGMYDKYVSPGLRSMLTDTNQMQDNVLSSVTDDLNTVLYLPHR